MCECHLPLLFSQLELFSSGQTEFCQQLNVLKAGMKKLLSVGLA